MASSKCWQKQFIPELTDESVQAAEVLKSSMVTLPAAISEDDVIQILNLQTIT